MTHMPYYQKCCLLCVFVFCFLWTVAQQSSSSPRMEQSMLNNASFASSIQEDPLLVNGRIYRIFRSKAQGNPFLFSDEWYAGTIHIMQHEFNDREVKYDVYQDALILRIQNETANYTQIRLNESFIDSFVMAGHRKFVRTKVFSSPKIETNYAEIIANDNISLIRTYEKSFIEIYNNFTPDGSYGDLATKEFLIKDKKVVNVSKKRFFVRAFDNYKNQIRRYMRKNDIKYRKASKMELIRLMDYCNELSENN